MNAKLLCVALAVCLTLTACSSTSTSENRTSQEESVATETDESVSTASAESVVTGTSSQEIKSSQKKNTESTRDENTMKNVSLDKVPNDYYRTADQEGTLEDFTYDTKDCNKTSLPATSQEESVVTKTNESVTTAPDESVVTDTSSKETEPAQKGDTESTQDENTMINISLGKVPNGYYNTADRQGTLENFTYDTKDYIGNGNTIQSSATVYLPYGYDQNDPNTQYNILYLQHGAYGNERTWMYEYGDSFKNMIDNMIEDKLIPPLIIVMPYLPSGNEWYHDTTPIFYSEELKNDLMPAVEAHYHTYAEDTSDNGFEASRSHRAFGGFSAGGTTTWRVFLEGMDRFEYFMPMSGGLTLGGDGSTDVEDATLIADTAAASGYGKREYYVFSATGTQDVAYQGLTAQMEYMKTLTNAFDYTQTGFADGNLMYYTVEGNRHDYQYTYEYVFNGLQCLFSWY